MLPDLLRGRAAVVVDAGLDLAAIVALGAIVLTTARLSHVARDGRFLVGSLAFASIELIILVTLWFIGVFGGEAWHLAELSLVALLAWACARAALGLGLHELAVRDGRAPAAPLVALIALTAGLRALLFVGVLISPHLEAGGESRRIFLSTAQLRAWVAFVALAVVEGAIARLSGRLCEAR